MRVRGHSRARARHSLAARFRPYWHACATLATAKRSIGSTPSSKRWNIQNVRNRGLAFSVIEARSLLGNGCALFLCCQQECHQNSPDDADNDNISKIPMNAVLPRFHSLDRHYRSMDQALAGGEG